MCWIHYPDHQVFPILIPTMATLYRCGLSLRSSDTSITIAGNTVAYTSTTDPQTFDIGGISLERLSAVSNWSHIAVVASSSSDALLYVDGQKSSTFDL